MRANMGGAGRENVAGNWAYAKGKLTLTADGGWRRDVSHYSVDSTGTQADPGRARGFAGTIWFQPLDLLPSG